MMLIRIKLVRLPLMRLCLALIHAAAFDSSINNIYPYWFTHLLPISCHEQVL